MTRDEWFDNHYFDYTDYVGGDEYVHKHNDEQFYAIFSQLINLSEGRE